MTQGLRLTDKEKLEIRTMARAGRQAELPKTVLDRCGSSAADAARIVRNVSAVELATRRMVSLNDAIIAIRIKIAEGSALGSNADMMALLEIIEYAEDKLKRSI